MSRARSRPTARSTSRSTAPGTLTVQNVGTTLATRSFTVGQGTTTQNSGTLNITVSQGTNVPVITATTATLGLNANLGIQYGSFVTAPSSFTLISTPTGGLNIDPSDIQRYNAQVGSSTTLPFLFASASIRKPVGRGRRRHDILQLSVVPKTVGTGVGQLDLTGYGKTLFSLANVAIVHDPALGAAMIAGVNSLEQAQAAYDSFAPDVSGGTRAIAISLTDQATGVVAARQRALRPVRQANPATSPCGATSSASSSAPRAATSPSPSPAPTAALEPGFKDHGFGFSLGIDEGGANSGWYGAAFTFYTGDVSEGGDRVSKVSTLWYLLTGYTDWRGKGLFFDSQLTVGYGNLKGKRFIELALPTPTAGGLDVHPRSRQQARRAFGVPGLHVRRQSPIRLAQRHSPALGGRLDHARGGLHGDRRRQRLRSLGQALLRQLLAHLPGQRIPARTSTSAASSCNPRCGWAIATIC